MYEDTSSVIFTVLDEVRWSFTFLSARLRLGEGSGAGLRARGGTVGGASLKLQTR